jgi:hypothetical protein
MWLLHRAAKWEQLPRDMAASLATLTSSSMCVSRCSAARSMLVRVLADREEPRPKLRLDCSMGDVEHT